MKVRKLRIIFGIFSAILFISLIIKLTVVPGGLILSGLFLGGIILIGILICVLILSGILKLFLKKYSFSTLYFITLTISFTAYHYHLYSPTLKIIVPDGYTGEINMVLSNVNKNILTLDSNGIGYVNKWTFNKTYTPPDVFTTSGKQINNQCVGFNSSTFWALSKFCCVNGNEIRSLSFEIVPENKKGQKQYYSKNFTGIDTKKLYRNK